MSNGTTDKKYLTAKQLNRYLGGIDQLGHVCVIRLLINAIPLNEIRKLRLKDVKANSKMIRLKKPRRKAEIDVVTHSLLIQYIDRLGKAGERKLNKNSKIFTYTERTIRLFIKEYATGCGFKFEVNHRMLFNTFWIIHLSKEDFQDWTVVNYANHLGNSSLDYTQNQMDYFKNEIEKLQSNEQ